MATLPGSGQPGGGGSNANDEISANACQRCKIVFNEQTDRHIKCVKCSKRFHQACVSIDPNKVPLVWSCLDCFKVSKPSTETGTKAKTISPNACRICGKKWNGKLHMVQCQTCPDWYHNKCLELDDKVEVYGCRKCFDANNPGAHENEENETENEVDPPPLIEFEEEIINPKLNSTRRNKKEETKQQMKLLKEKFYELKMQQAAASEDEYDDDGFEISEEELSGASELESETESLAGDNEAPPKPDGGRKFFAPRKRSTIQLEQSLDQFTNYFQRERRFALPTWNGEAMSFMFLYNTYKETRKLFSDVENKNRIADAITCSEAKKKVSGLLSNPKTVPEAMEILKDEYAEPEVVIDECIARVRATESPTERKPETIRSYAMEVRSLAKNIEAIGDKHQDRNPTLLKELAERLPYSLQKKWNRIKRKNAEKKVSNTIKQFSKWLYEESKDYIGLKSQSVIVRQIEKKEVPKSSKPKVSSVHVNQQVKPLKQKRECICCCSSDHFNLDKCSKFIEMSLEQREDFSKKQKLCFACLKKNHLTADCRNKPVEDAKVQNRHALLRKERDNDHHQVLLQNDKKRSSMFRIIPVKLSGPAGEIETHALIDDASDITLIETELASMLQLKGKRKPLSVKWTNQEAVTDDDSRLVSMKISGVGKSMPKFNIMGQTRSMQLSVHSLNAAELKKKYPYLQRVDVQHLEKVRPRILLGLDNLSVTKPFEVESDDKIDGPIAFKTPLGWTIHGPENHYVKNEPMTSLMICECEPRDEQEYERIDNMIISFFDTEKCSSPIQSIESEEDIRARNILEATTKLSDENHYETGLLFKHDEVKFPNNFPYAMKRLVSIENKMKCDRDYKEKYHKKINDYIAKGYAQKLSTNQLKAIEDNMWLLPHFGTSTINKPKLRLVFDAKAKFHGTSLNDQLIKGPDMYNSLVGVLRKFREGRFAVVGDIMEMFHMIQIREQDRRFQCFLWREEANQKSPDVYQMKAMTFGATCSPCSAQFVKNKNAEKFADSFPRASQAIVNNFYVDDYMDSFDTIEEAKSITQQVIDINAKGGFILRNILSNVTDIVKEKSKLSDSMLMSINEKEDYPTEKVLGVQWNVQDDNFTYKVNYNKIHLDIQLKSRAPTKREFLTILMSVFDPLGLINHFVVRGKVLLQDIWTREIKWDQRIPNDLDERWKEWFEMLKTVSVLKFPRCYSRLFMSADEIILCVCGDASPNIYAACAYFRIKRGDDIEVILVGGKTKVASKKVSEHQTIPRMELLAAELVTKLALSVKNEHTIPIAKVILCSDSTTVLSWLKMKFGAFKPFVANRVVKIKETLPDAIWQYIPSKDNPADEATKVTKTHPFDLNNKWFTGPTNLWREPLNWEKSSKLEVLPDDPEVYSVNFSKINKTEISEENYEIINASDYSCWFKMLQRVAWIQRGLRNCLMKIKNKEINMQWLNLNEMTAAETVVIRQAQKQSFPEEYKKLFNNEMISTKSPIWSCSPFLDENGVIRMSSRILKANISNDMKYPMILSRKHPATSLLIASYHERFRHRYDEAVANEMKTRFWIPHLKKAIKTIRQNCQVCKIDRATPEQPQMGLLPIARLDPMCSPFHHTGTDLAGPYNIVIGRNRVEKRWIVLFTCMTFRAVYLDIVVDLSSDSMIQSVLNCNSRRGPIKYLYSDQGTNMIGAKNELQNSINDINDDELKKKCLEHQIEWTHNTPLASWAAGSWERMIKSTKEILDKMLNERKLRDHSLRHFLCLCEEVINARPLTYVSLETDSDDVLTPKHFINPLYRATPPSPGEFENTPQHCRKVWRVVESLADQFKKQWIQSVLPELTRRSKWYAKAEPLKVDDIVIICDPKMKRNQWERARITSVIPSSDGQVRAVWLATSHGPLKRAAAMLAKIDLNPTKVNLPTNDVHHQINGATVKT